MNMRRTTQAHTLVATAVGAGDVAIDATAGNGHDTVFLAGRVGRGGRVFAFDVQRDAIAATRAALAAAGEGLGQRVELILADHASMAEHLPRDVHRRIAAIMFNLGYLPGGDKTVTTRVESTLAAVDAATRLLRPGGMVTVLGYVGHAAGRDEVAALETLPDANARLLDWFEHQPDAAAPGAPRLFVGIRKED